MQVGGDLKFAPSGSKKLPPLPMSVAAKLTYVERVVEATRSRSLAYRYYETAEAALKVDKGGETPVLKSEHRLVGVEVAQDATTLFCPTARLTREELDLIDVPGNSLVIHELLPKGPIQLGGTWQHDDRVLAKLLGLEAVSFTDAQSVLSEVKDSVATVVLGGTVGGAIAGVGTEMQVKAKYTYDLTKHRITWFALLIKEKRAVGHVNPGLDVVAKIIMRIAPVETPPQLAPERLAKLPRSATADLTALVFTSPERGLRFKYDPRWYITSDESDLVIMRMVDRGDLVAQCNVSRAKESAKPVTLPQFQRDVEQALGKNFSQFVEASEYTDERGIHVSRVVARGNVSNLPIQWIYYLLTGKDGRQTSVAFTLEEQLTDRFGRADRELVADVELVPRAAKTVLRPTKRQ